MGGPGEVRGQFVATSRASVARSWPAPRRRWSGTESPKVDARVASASAKPSHVHGAPKPGGCRQISSPETPRSRIIGRATTRVVSALWRSW